ncbi:tRNA pseudouridine(38-40) synthase TruA [Oceanobacillus luteolus]|uniref:tRNA pseudouridine synthase A n=1 Tax=Oceanobacillus luteolus TaxID=1274358 RepID=A0ABW4HVC5_9BACI|nr:tRNA pseudouridine(38-40) synthase TruA [Oceanobacillus luteolus]MCM3741016.1 tRNA pseudouridine(38-40) synthase TruA [Oceanobacillus luteolus]
MTRIKCTLAYDGSNFYGFQIQPDKRTVAGELEQALKKIHKGESIRIQGSGRTDTGVHAEGQVIHFDSKLSLGADNWKKALNALLPDDIFIKAAEIVSEDFHARFNAKMKEYHYYVRTSPERDVFSRNYAYHVPEQLNLTKMQDACAYLKGTHDFTTFSSVKATVQGSRVRTLYTVTCEEHPNGFRFVFIGDGFLYNMVRILVSFLLDVGRGKWQPEETLELLAAKDRTRVGKTIGPEGLYLVRVVYE